VENAIHLTQNPDPA